MAIKASALTPPYEAGDYDYSGVPPEPSVPVGFTRYLTNIATANTGIGSIFQGISVEDDMPIHLSDSVTPTGSAGYIDGFLLTTSATAFFYVYAPSTGSYTGFFVQLVYPMTAVVGMESEFTLSGEYTDTPDGVDISLVLPQASASDLSAVSSQGVNFSLVLQQASTSSAGLVGVDPIMLTMGIQQASSYDTPLVLVNEVNLLLGIEQASSSSLEGYQFLGTNKIVFIRG